MLEFNIISVELSKLIQSIDDYFKSNNQSLAKVDMISDEINHIVNDYPLLLKKENQGNIKKITLTTALCFIESYLEIIDENKKVFDNKLRESLLTLKTFLHKGIK